MSVAWDKILTSLQKLTYKNIIAIALLCVVGLGTFYSYRLIESYKFMVERVEETPRTKYLREFGLDNLESTLLIRDILVSTRQEIKANQVSVWGYHNGVEIGPFPFRKISLLDEAVGSGDARLAKKYQGLPLNLYVDITVRIWKADGAPVWITVDDAKENYPNVYFDMIENDYYAQFLYAITLDEYEPPIGLVAAYFSKEEYEAFRASPELEIVNREYLFNQAKRIELIFNRMDATLKKSGY